MAYRTDQERTPDKLQPPQALEAEQAVLGAALKDKEALNETIEVIDNPEIFYSPKHQIIYRGILNLYEQSEPCDITTLSDHLMKGGQLEKIGGRVYLVDLVESVVSTANTKNHAYIVLDKFLLRRLIQTSNEIARSCYAMEQPVDDLLDYAEQNVFTISERRLRKGFRSIKDLLPSTYDEIERLQSGDSSLVGIKSGFSDLDILTNGLHKGDLVIVAGRPSMGKTALALNIAEHVAVKLEKPVGVFSVEMSDEQLALRMLCSRAGVSQQRLRAGKLSDQEWSNLATKGGVLHNAPIYIDDSPGLSSLELRAKARRLKAQSNAELIIVDYIQLVHASGRYENRQQEIATISRGLKSLAKELDVPVVACSQLSRQVEQRGGDKRPQLSDLRESGALEQDADVVMFIYRPEFYLSADERKNPANHDLIGAAEVIVAKQRNGPTGTVHLTFQKELTRFVDQTPSYREVPPDVQAEPEGDIPF